MKKRIYISLIVVIVLMVSLIININKPVKGYSINKAGNDINVKGNIINDDELSFHTFVKLGEEEALSSSIIEITLRTQIELDNSTDKYVLKNPKLQVNPIGCDQYDKEEYIGEATCSANYQFGIKPNESFKNTIDIGIAKELLDSKNIRIDRITSESDLKKINSIDSLKKSNENNSKVTVEFTTLNQYYTGWYNIKFKPTASNEGTFMVY